MGEFGDTEKCRIVIIILPHNLISLILKGCHAGEKIGGLHVDE
jgi:hypothetical protein